MLLEQVFYVTDRKWFEGESNIFIECGLTTEIINELPVNARILIIGSGLYRSFEKELHQARPDLMIVSVDPTLGYIDTDSCEESPYTINVLSGLESTWSYSLKLQNQYDYKIPDEEVIAMQKARLENATEIPGAVAALAPDLPFADGVFDMVIDVCGPALYLPIKEIPKYLEEIRRVTTEYANILISD